MIDSAFTARLAAFSLSDAPLPAAVMDQARRAFLNYLGCSLSGSRDEATGKLLAHADEFSGARNCTVIGRPVRLDAQHAVLLNCMQASVQGFDEVHLAAVIHPTGPVAAALMALIEHRSDLAVSGSQFLEALAIGIEVSCRVALVLATPGAGMHPGVFTTGLTGGLGAAAACGRLLGLDAQQLCSAFGIATAQAGGLRVAHGSMSLSLVPGFSSRAGLSAALMAARGVTGSAVTLEGKNGLFDVFAPGATAQHLLQDPGVRFAMLDLSFKPYPCGVVIHPAIDAGLAIAAQAGDEAIKTLTLALNPLALQFGGVRHPADAPACNGSLYHWAAVALLRARAGLGEIDGAALRDPQVAALRDRIEAVADPAVGIGEAKARAQLESGRTLECHIAHTRGSVQRPLTGEELATKFLGLAAPVLGDAGARALLAQVDALPGMHEFRLMELYSAK